MGQRSDCSSWVAKLAAGQQAGMTFRQACAFAGVSLLQAWRWLRSNSDRAEAS